MCPAKYTFYIYIHTGRNDKQTDINNGATGSRAPNLRSRDEPSNNHSSWNGILIQWLVTAYYSVCVYVRQRQENSHK